MTAWNSRRRQRGQAAARATAGFEAFLAISVENCPLVWIVEHFECLRHIFELFLGLRLLGF